MKISKAQEFIDIFDKDKDGYLDEDEQILIFSVVKSKLQIVAEALCDIHNYTMYKALMKEVRDIELQVVDYQDKLRQKIYVRQLGDYKSIGEQMVKDEKRHWDQRFKDEQAKLFKKVELLQQNQEQDEETLRRALEHPRESAKFVLSSMMENRVKSLPKLKGLQYQEKLVAINERVEEAMNYRKELKVLEKRNEEKKKELKEMNDFKVRERLAAVKEKELKELNAKIKASKQLMQRERMIEMEVVNKKINLHVKDIERMQGLLSKYAKTKGRTEDELRRVRDNARKTMQVMASFKRVSNAVSATGRKSPSHTLETQRASLIHTSNPFVFTNKKLSLSGQSSMDTWAQNNPTYKNIIEPLQRLAKSASFVKFEIRSTVVDKDQKPLNQQDESLQGGLEKRITGLLGQRKKTTQGIPSIAERYDDDLNPLDNSASP